MQIAQQSKVPNHVAIIMDGNGRWAQSQGLGRLIGHRQGSKAVKKVIVAAAKSGVKYLTLYAFSSENWNRPADEVNGLMTLLKVYIKKEKDELIKAGICVKVIGDTSRLPEDLWEDITNVIESTKNNVGMTLVIALSYGGRAEVVNAVKSILRSYKSGAISEKDIDEECFGNYLYTSDIPDPDLLIRTGGELRISNFLLWQCAYTEFYFTDTKWPDFNDKELWLAFKEFEKRKRRYGR
jgi:undecaprenyl diphosphate synthase